MTWLYLPLAPSTPSPSAPASEASNSDCSLLTVIAGRLSEASVTSKGKLLPSPAWSRRWKRGGYILRLSGLTLEPSTADRFADAWISSLRATRAKATASPESAAENSTTAGFSTAPSTSSIKAGLQPSSARTCRGTLTGSSPSLSRHWSDWAAALRSEYSARPKPAIRCAGSDSSSSPDGWAAPQARDHFPAHTEEYIAAKKAQGHGMRNLHDEAARWPAPQAGAAATEKNNEAGNSDFSRRAMELADALLADLWMAPNVPNGGRSTAHAEQVGNTLYHKGRKVQMMLESQASNWAAPAAQNHKGSSEGSIIRADGKSREDILSYQAEQFFRPPSSPAQPIAGGAMCSTASPNTNQPSVKRKLNPIFVEALMRWPTGLSGFERPETAWIRWWQQQLSYVSMLCSPVEAAQREMF